MSKQIVVTLLKYGLGVGLLACVVWKFWAPTEHSPGLSGALEKPIHVGPFLFAIGAYLGGLLLTFYRWYLLVRAQNLPFSLAAALQLGLIGFYLSTFLPGSVGGDIIKAAFIARAQKRRTVAVATVLVDRFMGLCGLFALVAVVGGTVLLSGQMPHIAKDASAAAYLETIVFGAVILTVFNFTVWFAAGFVSDEAAARFAHTLERVPKIGHSLAELWRALHMYRQRGAAVALALLLSMVGHVGFVLAFYFAASTLTPMDQIPTLAAHYVIVPVGMTIEAGVPSPGGVGAGEIGFGTLYEMVGFAMAAGVLGSLVRRVISWILGVIGYIVYLRMKPALELSTTKPLEAMEAEPGVIEQGELSSESA